MEKFDPSLLRALPQYRLRAARPLSGGLSNRCWVVELDNIQTAGRLAAVWRPQAESTEVFGLSRRHEHRILSSLQGEPVAPRSIALLEKGLLVEWVEGEMADSRLPDEALLELQSAIHCLPVPAWRLDVQDKARHYWQHIPRQFKSGQLRQIVTSFAQLTPQVWFDDTCCHHDLGRYNIICQPDGCNRVIDWEYAAAGDPSLDLALTIAANNLDPAIAVATYCRLQGRADSARWLAAVEAWQPWCDYLAMLWYFVAAGLWQDDECLRQARLLQNKLAALLA